MNTTLNIQKSLLVLLAPLAIIVLMALLTQSSLFLKAPHKLSLAITADLLIISPFIYYLLIRTTTIPKTTVVLFIVLGVITSSLILPEENQYYLNLFKTWILPAIEISILGFVIYNIVKARRLYKINKESKSADFYTILKKTCNTILPAAIVIPFVTEIAVIYYGFINWKTKKLNTNEFSYHKDSGTQGLLIALIFLIAIETVAIHLLLVKWSAVAAWILTGLSIYSAIQILGFVKSMSQRPISIEGFKLHLRYGIMNETSINIEDIKSIEFHNKDIELSNLVRKLSFLGDLEGHNIVITLNTSNTITGLYGTKKEFKTLALHVDNKQEFKKLIDALMKYNF